MSGKKSKGLYCRVKGDWHAHEKVIALSLEARGLWVTLASWCAGNRTDGHFNEKHARALAQGKHAKPLAELVGAGLVDRMTGGSFQMHDWAEHNITRAEHETLKASDLARKARNRGVGEGESFRAESERKDAGTRPDSAGIPLEAPSPSPGPRSSSASREGGYPEREPGQPPDAPHWLALDGYSTDGELQ